LYLDGVSEAMQPGVHIRRVRNRRLNDEEMIRHYARLASSMGGRVAARYRNALCIATADNRMFERFDDSVASEPFYLVDRPHSNRTPGFPLDSLSVEIAGGRYYFDLGFGRAEDDLAMCNGFANFVQEVMNQL
jgi:8-oxo-dGTP diphosphatase